MPEEKPEVSPEGVTPEASVTPKETAVTKEVPEVTPEERELIDSESVDQKVKDTLAKIREERDAEKKRAKAAQSEAEALKKTLKDKEEAEAIAKGEWKTLAESKQTEAQELKSLKESLESEYNEYKELTTKELKNFGKSVNKLIDKHIENWPEEAKARLATTEGKNTSERLEKYLDLLPFIEELVALKKKTGTVSSPGTGPSPQPVTPTGAPQGPLTLEDRVKRMSHSVNY